MLGWLARHRAYVIAVIAASVVVALPGRDNDGRGQSLASRALEAGGSATAGAPGTGGATSGAADGTGIAVASPTASAAARRQGSAAASNATAATAGSGPTGAGLNSTAALSAPDCDAGRQRLKVSYVYGPSCAVPWPAGADNGGATSMGVTAESIKLVVVANDDDTTRQTWAEHVEMFSRFFRTWGRKLDVVFFPSSGTDEVSQRADAVKIASLRPFAVIEPPLNSPGRVFRRELANRGVIMGDPTNIASDMLSLAPFMWSLGSPDDWMSELNAAQWIGLKLVGRPARWSGDISMQTQTRKFGVILPDNWDRSVFEKEFAARGGAVAVWETHDNSVGAAPTYQERARTMVAKFKAAGVTSIINFASFLLDIVITKEATSQRWFPEWILSGWGGADIELFARLFDPAQWQHAFGLMGYPVGGDPLGPHEWFHHWYWGENNSQAVDASIVFELHWLFTGIHGAGPRLTSQAFRDGLFALPPSGGTANGAVMSYQVSFGRHGFMPWDDYSYQEDFAEGWWDATAQGKDNLVKVEGTGKYRFLNGGRRQAPGGWTPGEPSMFKTDGTVLWLSDYPANDRPPSYPCTGCPSTS